MVGSPCSLRDSQESSPIPQFKSINSLALSFLYSPTLTSMGFPGGSEVKASACNAGDPSSIPGLGRSLEKEMASHSSTAWRIPWTEEPGGLYCSGGLKELDTTK